MTTANCPSRTNPLSACPPPNALIKLSLKISVTPRNPVINPPSLSHVIFSSAKKKWAMINEKSGTVPFSTEATPESMCVSPHVISTKGRAVLVRPNKHSLVTVPKSLGRGRRSAAMMIHRPPAPSYSRSITSVKGLSSSSPNLIKRNDEPQMALIRKNRPHSRYFIMR